MASGPDELKHLRSEGDLNLGPLRASWIQEHTDAETRELLEEDARYFLHQSLSSPCLDVLARAEGITIEDVQGRRFMDFHGNNVHQVGFGNPRVVAAVKKQLDELPFCTRRYTNRPAISLAKKLVELAPGDLNKILLAPGGTSAIGIALSWPAWPRAASRPSRCGTRSTAHPSTRSRSGAKRSSEAVWVHSFPAPSTFRRRTRAAARGTVAENAT